MRSTTSHLLAFIAGASAGAVFGILFAPDKGSNTRDRLTYRLDKYREALKEITEDMVKGKEMPSNVARSEGQKVITDAKNKAERLLDDVEELIGQIKNKK